MSKDSVKNSVSRGANEALIVRASLKKLFSLKRLPRCGEKLANKNKVSLKKLFLEKTDKCGEELPGLKKTQLKKAFFFKILPKCG